MTFDKKKHCNRGKFRLKYKQQHLNDNQCKSSPIFMTNIMTTALKIEWTIKSSQKLLEKEVLHNSAITFGAHEHGLIMYNSTNYIPKTTYSAKLGKRYSA